LTTLNSTESDERFDVSVIIPNNHCHADLSEVVLEVCKQTVTPSEIIIIDSSDERGNRPEEIINLCTNLKITLKYESIENAFPGQARNIGLALSHSTFIAFIDVKTHPLRDWLKNAKTLLQGTNTVGVWGFTKFEAETKLEKTIRDGFFGRISRRTLPGTVLDKQVFTTTGRFIAWARAGEDTDWIQRVELHGLGFNYPPDCTINYKGLLNQGLAALARKWSRNYSAASSLPHLLPQKILLWTIFYPTLILFALNWNNLLAGWDTESFLYVPNVTKLAIIGPIISYLATRAILVPFQRGVPIKELIPFRWISIAAICIAGDLTKTLMLITPLRYRKLGKNA